MAYNAEKVKYEDGIGCCIWQVVDEKNPDSGLAWDFPFEDIDVIISLLQDLKSREVKVFTLPEEEAEMLKKSQLFAQSWRGKLHRCLRHVGVVLHPFEWRLTGNTAFTLLRFKGVTIGPLSITW